MKDLVGSLAHSVNNSLAPLAGYIALLADEIRPGVPGQQYVGKLEGALHKSETLLVSILQATHPERQFAPKQCDLTALLHRTTEGWLKSLPPGCDITVIWHVAPCSLWLDELQMTRVIQQLLSNAQFAMGLSGMLEISLQSCELTPAEAECLGVAERLMMELRFADTGMGMSNDVLDQACFPLFSTHPHGVVKGLGLTLAHSVVHLHGGQLVLESEPDAGTVVRVWLPQR
jgi:signal transduction histidine kinase